MSEAPKTHGVPFQQQVLKLMMLEDRFGFKASELLDEAFFAGNLKWFFRKFQEIYREYKVPPKASVIQNEILKHDYAEAQAYLNTWMEILKADPQPDYIKKELTGFIRKNIFVGSFKEAATLYNAGSTTNAYAYTKAQMEALMKVDFEKERTAEFGDAPAVMERARLEAENAVPTGITAIDNAILGGGLLPGTWTTFLGGSNSGKSMLCPNLAYAAMKKGKKTFCTIHEDEETATKLRYLSRFSGIPFSRLLLPTTMLEQSEIDSINRADAILKDFVKLRFMYTTESTIEAVQQAARMLHKEWPFELFICDYGQCLTTSRFKTIDNTRLLQEYIYHELKQLCLELNVAGAGGAQVNRQGHAMAKTGADFLRCTDVGESWGIVKKSSNVITINRSEQDIINNRMVFLLDKVRNGRCPVAVECITDFQRSTTHSDATGMQRDLTPGAGLAPAKNEPDADPTDDPGFTTPKQAPYNKVV